MVSFVFDDGNDTDYLVGKEIFSRFGLVASTAITTGFIGTPEHLTPAQIVALRDAGWEIMAHTETHPNLRSLEPAAMAREFAASKRALEELGLRVDNLVYPYNKHNETVRTVAAGYFRSGRGGTNAFNRPPVDPYALRSFSLKHDQERMKSLVDTAYADKSWLIVYLHEITAKLRISDYSGSFRKGETVRLSPSGSLGRVVTVHWFPLYGYIVYLVPLAGEPRTGDRISGAASDASAVVDGIVYNERTQLTDLLGYIRGHYPDLPVVTIDAGLDLLQVPKFMGRVNAQR